MNETFINNPVRLKKLMEAWFLHYHSLNYEEVSGMDVFTIFDKIPSRKKGEIIPRLNLMEGELPVFILTVGNEGYIVNTTHRFIRLYGRSIESINYADFKYHTGYKSIGDTKPAGARSGIKTDGYLADFGLKMKTGDVIYWTIPTGRPGFGFWNVTKRCGLD